MLFSNSRFPKISLVPILQLSSIKLMTIPYSTIIIAPTFMIIINFVANWLIINSTQHLLTAYNYFISTAASYYTLYLSEAVVNC